MTLSTRRILYASHEQQLQKYVDDGRCWVATTTTPGPANDDDGGQIVVAYLLASRVDGTAHVEQVSVNPTAARRDLGAALIDHPAAWAAAQDLSALTLTTFADGPWNAPYYRRIGFRKLESHEVGEALCEIRKLEGGRGLDRWPRMCMRRELLVPVGCGPVTYVGWFTWIRLVCSFSRFRRFLGALELWQDSGP
ncbi:hypothetical protein ACJ73_07271 [Blastomyces percursus]|uniref:N-acetyltransferase domain-containing protein n=1 Tax=Blastomyces percursus TaxID=1658174 RepID=A0A1J9QMG7_9EURO|nr:hypothetical protein ACJ73_07271 [Blastomyces percursus]